MNTHFSHSNTPKLFSFLVISAILFAGCWSSSDDTPKVVPPKETVARPIVIERDLKYPVPDGADAQGLLDYINKLAEQPAVGNSHEERTNDLASMMDSRCTAAEMIMAGEEADVFGHIAAQIKLESLRVISNTGRPKGTEAFLAYAKELSESKDEEVARFGRLGLFRADVDKILQPEGTPEATVARVDELLATETVKDRMLVDVSAEAMELLNGIGYQKPAGQVADLIRESFKDNEDPDVVSALSALAFRSKVMQLDSVFVKMMEGDRKAQGEFLETTQSLLASQPPVGELGRVMDYGQKIENEGKIKVARKIYDQLGAALEEAPSGDDLVELIRDGLERSKKRLGILGEKIEINGETLDGKKVNWADYEGKLVIVDFWATWCGPCIAEFPNLREQYEQHHENGLEIIGVNLDSDKDQLKLFYADNDLPWPTIVHFDEGDEPADPSADPKSNPIAERFGVETIPFVILVAPDGKVVALHARGDRLAGEISLRIDDTFEPKRDEQPEEEPKEDKKKDEDKATEKETEGSDEEPAAEEKGTDPADEPKELAEKEAAEEEAVETEEAAADAAPESDKTSANFHLPRAKIRNKRFLAQAVDAAGAAAELEANRSDDSLAEYNPYAPESDLSTKELTLFLLDMQDKTRSIQYREGFREAVVIGADRILDADGAKPAALREAVKAKLSYLHRDACLGDDDAEKQLAIAADAIRPLEIKAATSWVTFLDTERKAIAAAGEEGPPKEGLVEELTKFLDNNKEDLDGKHLRLASSIVDLINRDATDAREDQFQTLAAVLQASKNAEVKRYGRRLAGSPDGGGGGDHVGKTIELVGTTFDDEAFDAKSLKGQVIIVDFWATWCGPCRKAIPELQELYDKHNADGLEIVSVSLDKDLDALATFLDETDMPWIHLAGDETSKMAENYGVRGIPSMLLVDRQGKILAQQHHAGQFIDQLKAAIKEVDSE